MEERRTPEPPFDPRWLDLVGHACSSIRHTSPQLEDLFLERRLEVAVKSMDGYHHVEEGRGEGAAARWRFASRRTLHAVTGVSPQSITHLLSRYEAHPDLPLTRPVPPAELDAPRGWLDWARDLVGRLGVRQASVRFMLRHGVVITPQGWVATPSPPLVRVHIAQDPEVALLAVWQHPSLARWLGELTRPHPDRPWRPPSGLAVPVLFSRGTGGVLIHELVGHMLEADIVGSEASPLHDMRGVSVTAATINVEDDPTRFDLPGAFSHDDEGVAARPVALIRRGVVRGWLCDRLNGDTLQVPAGRGRRSAWNQPPVARMSNLVTAAGESDPSVMESSLDHGLLLTRVAGATVDPVSGRTVIRVERGWEIRYGSRRRQLAPFELTGNVLAVLAGIDTAVGNDPTPDWRLGWCVKEGVPLPTGAETPSLLVHRLEVL